MQRRDNFFYRKEVNSEYSKGCCICDDNIPDKLHHLWMHHEGKLYHGNHVIEFIISAIVFMRFPMFIATVAWFVNVFKDTEYIAKKKFIRKFSIVIGFTQCVSYIFYSIFVTIIYCLICLCIPRQNWCKRVYNENIKPFTYTLYDELAE